MTTTHNDRINISVLLDAPPLTGAVFTVAMLLSATSTLGADTTRTYTSTRQLDTDVDAGELSAAARSACATALADPNVDLVKVGAVSLYDSTNLDAVIAADSGFYGIGIESRADADILAISAAVETKSKLFVAQTDDADAKTAGLPAGLSALAGRQNTGLVYHNDAAVFSEFGELAGALSFDPSAQSAPWNRNVAGVQAASGVTEGEKLLLRGNNINVALPYFSNTAWMDPGVNMQGRPLHEVVSLHWIIDTIQVRVARAASRFSALGRKWPLNRRGQGTLRGIVETVLQEAVAAEHLDPGQYQVLAPPITDTDRAQKRLRVTFTATLLGQTLQFDVDGSLLNSPIFEDA